MSNPERSPLIPAAVGAVFGSVVSVGLRKIVGDEGASAVGNAIGSMVETYAERMLSRVEKERIATVVEVAAERVHDRIAAGDLLRPDVFFDSVPGNESFYVEIVEGVLTVSRDQYEERKLAYLGKLMANLAFDESASIDRVTANFALRTASELSWTQYVLLSIVGRDDLSLPDVAIGRPSQSWRSWAVHEELEDLGWGKRGLIGAPMNKTDRVKLSYPETNAAAMRLQSGGRLLFLLMELHSVDIIHCTEVLSDIVAEDADIEGTVEDSESIEKE